MNNLTDKESMIIEFQMMFGDDVIETLVAFANTLGGTVYIGIAENGAINGLTINEETVELWKTAIQLNTSPQLRPECKILTIEDKLVVSVYAEPSKFKPISFKGRFFKRVGGKNLYMSAEEITIEYLKTKNLLHGSTQKENVIKPQNTKKERAKKNKRLENKDKIIKLIENNNNITLKEMALKIGISMKGVERNIKILKAEGVVERVGNDRSGCWRIRNYEL